MKRLLYAFIFTLIALPELASAQPGTVLNYSKISAAPNSLGPSPQWRLGTSMVMLNDLDGDGIRELAAVNYFGGRNYIYIFRLNANGTPKPNYTVIGADTGGLVNYIPTSFQYFGYALANMGDMNGNGVDELAAGNPNGNEFFLLFMNNAGKVDSFKQIGPGKGNFPSSVPATQGFGNGISNIGDLDHDGVNDLAVGAVKTNSNSGNMWIVFLHANGTVKGYKEIKSNTAGFNYSISADDWFGYTVSGIGDLDKDGHPDLMVSALKKATSRGEVFTLFMNPDGSVKNYYHYLPGTPTFIDTPSKSSWFGFTMALIGDIDGDSVQDVAIGAYENRDSSGNHNGRVYVWMLNTDGSIKAFQRIDQYYGNFTAPMTPNYYFGSSLATCGDWNGDGKKDLLVGALGDDDADPFNPNRNSGAIYFLYLDGIGSPPVQNGVGDLIYNQTQDYYAYPNPASDKLIIRPRNRDARMETVTLLDATGRVRLHLPVQDASVTLDVSALPAGNYFIRVADPRGAQTVRFVRH